ncbi:hypothetical protein TNCV_4354561 [Trichonephila clavipes]|nr:hypothetical protein TNCV_4354561 [Trichonephila clavipes]
MFVVLETWVRRGGRDFGSGGPMGVQETSAMEVIFDWRMEVHEQMSRFGGLSEERPSVFKNPSKLGTHLSTLCSGDERQSRSYPAR